MDFRAIIKSIIREELSQTSTSASPPTSTVPTTPERSTILAQLEELGWKMRALDAREADTLADEKRIARLELELVELQTRVQAHHAQLWVDSLNTSTAIDKQLALLKTTCSPLLDHFLEMMRKEHTRLLGLEPQTQWGPGEKNIFTENPRTPRLVFSDSPAIARRARAVAAAISRAEELKVLERSDEELKVELEGLQAALPPIENVFELVDRI